MPFSSPSRPPRAPGESRTRRRAAAQPDALAFTIEDAQAMGAPCRTKIYMLARDGRLKMFKVARRVMIDGDSLRALLHPAD